MSRQGRAFGFFGGSKRGPKAKSPASGFFGSMMNSAADSVGSASSLYGSFDGGYGKKKDDCEGISLATLLTTFASIGVVFFAVFTKLTMIGRRRKRSADDYSNTDFDLNEILLDNLHILVTQGILLTNE